MASHLAAQDYLARLQASGLNFPGLGNPTDPYSSLGLTALASGHHKSSKNSKSSTSSSSSLPKQQSQGGGNLSSKEKSVHNAQQSGGHGGKSGSDSRHDLNAKTSSPMPNSKGSASTNPKYSNVSGLTIQPSISNTKLTNSSYNAANTSSNEHKKGTPKNSSNNDIGYMKNAVDKPRSTPPSTSIFTNPLSMASNIEKSSVISNTSASPPPTSSSTVPSLPSSILR